MTKDRRAARVLAMQTLCQWEVQGEFSAEAMAELLAAIAEWRPELEVSPPAVVYTTALVQDFRARQQEVDEWIARTSANWDLARISTVERNVLRVAVVELLRAEVPPKVVINEAIEIAREYGGRDSPAFVNGVLDRILKSAGQSSQGS
ncbi:MAG TPA: transcription antitermination factor NusB [Phycisphaerae bacterium]|nr:transcription antitermination factor NusB [Phycisphaerae bacterium]HNU45840.1 transcription antitermination factor NusB [Phycisphaerae bacterium]